MAAASASSDNDRIHQVKKFDESKAGVKGLSESGLTSIPNIFIHPFEILSTLTSSSAKYTSIPLIDLADVNSPVSRPKIVQQIKEAAKTWGFFQVINHGIPISALEETIQSVKEFHEQPAETKAKYYNRDELGHVLYSSNNDLYRSNAATWHDYLHIKMSPVDRARMEEIPEACRSEAVAWDSWVTKVGEAVMELLCEGLGLESGKFKELTFSDERYFVGVYYPFCPQPDLTVGLRPHTDPGAFTILLPNQVPGLQVKHGEEWVDVKPVHGALTINIGDFLQIVSNGEYNSVQHRVLANPSKEPRISVVMFFNVLKWKGSGYYGPLPELLSPEKPPRYRDFTKEEFMSNFYSKALDSKSMIDKIKL